MRNHVINSGLAIAHSFIFAYTLQKELYRAILMREHLHASSNQVVIITSLDIMTLGWNLASTKARARTQSRALVTGLIFMHIQFIHALLTPLQHRRQIVGHTLGHGHSE